MSDNNDDDTLSEKLSELASSPFKGVRRLRKDFTTFDRNATDRLYDYLAMAFQVFLLVRTKAKIRQMIIDKLKPRSKKPDDEQLIRLVLRYLLDAPASGTIYDRARVYAAVLQVEVEKETDPADIPNAIRAGGGIEKIYEAQAEKKWLAKREGSLDPVKLGDDDGDDDETDSPGSENEGSGDGSGADDDHADDDDNDITSGKRVTGGPPPSKPASKKLPRIEFNPLIDLAVRCETEDVLADVLESKIERGLFHVDFHYNDDGTVKLTLRYWDRE